MRNLQVFILLSLIGFLWAQSTVETAPPTEATTTTELTVETTTTEAVTTTTGPPLTNAPTPPGGVPTAAPNTPTTTVLTTTTVPPVCPPSGIHHFPTNNCKEFVTCINGNSFLNICQDGFLFDTTMLRCEPAGVVDCGDRARP